MLTGQKAVREEEERKLLLADKKFSDERQMLNQDYFLKQGYHNIESAQKILSKTNGYV